MGSKEAKVRLKAMLHPALLLQTKDCVPNNRRNTLNFAEL